MTASKANAMSNNRDVQGIVGSLALSYVRPGASTLALRALRWYEQVRGLGVNLPFFFIHDMGMLLAADDSELAFGPRVAPSALQRYANSANELMELYGRFVREVAGCQAATQASSLRLSDDVISVVLSKLLHAVTTRVTTSPDYGSEIPSDASLFEVDSGMLLQQFTRVTRAFEWETLTLLREHAMFVLTMADTLDVDTLRLLGVLGTEAIGGAAHVDMIAALESPAAHDVVNFSLDILPSVLETKSKEGAMSRVGVGVSGLGRKGELDRLVLSELAWDAEDFARRVLDGEVLYYSRSTEAEPAGKRYMMLIDASASMRGQREVFARGMALATAKKLLLQGAEVEFRFFDSRLYPPVLASRRSGSRESKTPTPGNHVYSPELVSRRSIPTAHVLSFRGERGRNPRRVFTELLESIQIEAPHETRDMTVHLFTHAALYVPTKLIEQLKKFVKLAAVFMLPSGGRLDLDYVQLLDNHWVVGNEVLRERSERMKAAHDILGDVGERELQGADSHG